MILEITLTAIAAFTAGYVASKDKEKHIYTESATITAVSGGGASDGKVKIESLESDSTEMVGASGGGADGEIKQ